MRRFEGGVMPGEPILILLPEQVTGIEPTLQEAVHFLTYHAAQVAKLTAYIASRTGVEPWSDGDVEPASEDDDDE